MYPNALFNLQNAHSGDTNKGATLEDSGKMVVSVAA